MPKQNLSSDRPINSNSSDSFGRARFAEQLANTISQARLEDGFVIGLYSPWGYGKTSTLNMVEQYLESQGSIEMVKFNPWIFTDQQTMVVGLFNTLAEALDRHIQTKTEKLGELLGTYGKALSGLQIDGLAEAIGGQLSAVSIDDLKQRAEKIIAKSKKRLVVIIDDVDRLDKNELFLLFKLIKIGADFKNVVYLIAFDDEIVSKALSERYLGSEQSGQSFIEKIVQVPLHLPMIDQSSLGHYVLSGIDSTLDKQGIEISDDEVRRFRATFDEHISGLIDTPRMANRYINALQFVIPLVGEEINLTDLLLIEFIRLLYPSDYVRIRKLKNELSGASVSALFDPEKTRKEVLEELKETFSKQPDLLGILMDLFPLLQSTTYGNERDLRKSKRAASPDYFDRYFTYGIPLGDVSDISTLAAISGGSRDRIAESLQKLIAETSAEAVIKKLRSYGDELKGDETLIGALADIGDQFPDPPAAGFTDTPLEGSAMIMVVLAKTKPVDERKKIITETIDSAKNMAQLTHFIKWVTIESDGNKPDRLIPERELLEIHKHLGDKIKSDELKNGPLFGRSGRLLIYLYHYWMQGSGRDEVAAYLKEHIKSYEDACSFLTQCVSVWFGSGPPRRGAFDQPTYKYTSEIVEPEHIYQILLTKDKSLAAVSEFPQFKDGIDKLGNEQDARFKETLAKQFAYMHKLAGSEGAATE